MNFCNAKLLLASVLLVVSGCASTAPGEQQASNNGQSGNPRSAFALPQQQAPPSDIHSIELHPSGDPDAPPVISLDSRQKLTLSFDYLGQQSRQFRVEVSHRGRNWEKSSIPPSVYLDGFSSTYIQQALPSFSRRPSYRHVEYEFPNSQLQPAVSGNYLLEIFDYQDGNLLFSVPFFISEEEGSITTRVERLFAQRPDGRPLDQLYGEYSYPPFVEYPQFDLSMSFVQNRFWGRTREADYLDTITPGQLNGRLKRSEAYVGNYEFKTLDLREFDADGRQILEYNPAPTPPTIVLRRDLQKLDTNPRFFPISKFGKAVDDRGSSYARVEFSLDTGPSVPPSAEMYLVGHFNNWMINELNRMRFNEERGLWEGSALIKQGEYAYKYVLLRDNKIDDLALDQSFLSAEQEYLTFVYFKDPDRNFDRLLRVGRIVRR